MRISHAHSAMCTAEQPIIALCQTKINRFTFSFGFYSINFFSFGYGFWLRCFGNLNISGVFQRQIIHLIWVRTVYTLRNTKTNVFFYLNAVFVWKNNWTGISVDVFLCVKIFNSLFNGDSWISNFCDFFLLIK